MAHLRVLSGSGRFSDPWHPFAETSACIAEVLLDAGHEVTVLATDSPDVLTGLDDVDLVVVNSGGGLTPSEPLEADPAWADAYASFGAWLDAGGRALAVHTGVNTFRDWSEWAARVGAGWTPRVSGHPERSLAVFEPVPGQENHPALAGIDQVIAYDERYWRMDIDPGVEAYLRHESGEVFYDVCWRAPSGVLYDALGHNVRSYASPSRARLLRNEVDWLLRG